MDTLIAILAACQALGAVIGVGFSLAAEFAYLGAVRDGRIDQAERAHLDAHARGLRYGMLILLSASLGLVIVSYASGAGALPALSGSYWSFIGLALLVTVIAHALSRGRVSFSLGSAALFTGWWFIAYLAFGQMPELTLGAFVALYAVATVIFWGLLRYLRGVLTGGGTSGTAE